MSKLKARIYSYLKISIRWDQADIPISNIHETTAFQIWKIEKPLFSVK